MYLYIILTVIILILSFNSNFLFAKYNLQISKNIYNKMLSATIRTKMEFFDTTPQGTILNRFSKDVDSSDVNIVNYIL